MRFAASFSKARAFRVSCVSSGCWRPGVSAVLCSRFECSAGGEPWLLLCSTEAKRPQVEAWRPNEGRDRPEMAVHRIIEAHAARYGDAPAIADMGITLSYRELNQKANVIARYLIDHDFRRGMLAVVSMPRAADTAIILLGILKAGGRYALADGEGSEARWPRGVSFADKAEGDQMRFRTLDVAPA